MTTQTQGKGKKKNKEVTKISLDEFNSFDTPHGHSVISVKKTSGLDWAATMAHHEITTETEQIVVPIAPRAQLGPNIDFDALPEKAPFRASLYNLPMSAEEKDVSDRFFQGLDVVRVDITKSTTTVEFASRQDLFDALCKDGSNLKGKTVSVCLFGQQPQNSYNDRYGGRGGGSSYGDRYGDRDNRGGFGARMGDKYGDRPGGFTNREGGGGFTGYNRAGAGGGFGGGQRSGYGGGGFGDRFQDRGGFGENPRGAYTSGGGEPDAEEPGNWRDRPTVRPPPLHAQEPSYNNGSRQPYMHSRPDPPHYQHAESYHQPRYNQHHNQPSNQPPQSYMNDRPISRPPYDAPASSGAIDREERPKLNLKKRQTPVNIEDAPRNEAIFGKAKPTATPYVKMNEIDEKLKSVQISDKKSSHSGSQAGSQPGSAPRSRHVSERSRE